MTSLEVLDPSPIDSEESRPNSPSDREGPRKTSTASTLGISNQTLLGHLIRIHRFSTYPPTAFFAAHITNTSLIPLVTQSIPVSDTYLLLTRPYYQSPIAEPLLLIIPICLHLTTGALLRLVRRRNLVKHYAPDPAPWPHISSISTSGYCLAPLIAGHVLVNRLVPLWVEGGSSGVGLAYVAHGFAQQPIVTNIVYALLVGTGTAHLVWGWSKWLGLSKHSARNINIATALTAFTWMAGGLGIVGRAGKAVGWVGKGFDVLHRSIPLIR